MSLGGPGKTLEEEIAELRSSEKVEAELAALKAKRSGTGNSTSGEEG
jgi:phage shock protein A